MTGAIAVALLALFVLVATASAGPVAFVARRSARSRLAKGSAVTAGLAMLPLLLGALACVALLSPLPFSGCHCDVHAPHHPHLCFTHPALAAPLLVPSLVILTAWAALVAPRVLRLLADLRATRRWSTARAGCRLETVDGVRLTIADLGGPLAFTHGILRPTVMIDAELWAVLDHEQRRVVVHHERGHVMRRDPTTLFLLRLGEALCLWPRAWSCTDRWRVASELECDKHATAVLGDPLRVADALLSVERARAGSTVTAPAAALGATGGTALEQRVRALLDVSAPGRTALANDVLAVALVALGGASLVASWPGDWIHHAIETALGFAVR